MAYREAFWSTVATVDSAVLIAALVTLRQTMSAMIRRIEEQHSRVDPLGSRRGSKARRRGYARAYGLAGAAALLALVGAMVALCCLMNGANSVPPIADLLISVAAAAVALVQVFADADSELLRATPPD